MILGCCLFYPVALLNAEIDRKKNYQFPQKVYDAIDKQFGDNGLDNSSSWNENSITQNQARGDINDNGRVRKGASQATEVSGADGRRYSENAGASQENKSWDRLSDLVRKRVVGIVDSHIKTSKSQDPSLR